MDITSEQLEQLMAAVGELTPEIHEIVCAGDEPAWAVSLDGDVVVVVERDPETAAVWLMAHIGEPLQTQRTDVCNALMSWNALGAATQGLVLGLSGPGGEWVQLQQVPAQALQPAELGKRLLGFATKASLWRGLLEQGASASAIRSEWPAIASSALRA